MKKLLLILLCLPMIGFGQDVIGYSTKSYSNNSFAQPYSNLYKTTDSGVTWTYQSSLGSYDNVSISFVSSTTGYAICYQYGGVLGSSTNLLKTTDSGVTWTSQGSSIFKAISYVSSTIAFATDISDGSVFKTIDSGVTWTQQSIPGWMDISFVSSVTGFAVTGSGSVFKTIDSGVTWTFQGGSGGSDVYSISFIKVLGCTEPFACNYNSAATMNDSSCIFPAQQPTLACYEIATFNTTTCVWDVTGTQPIQPTLACYETANFNTTTCVWDITGTQLLASISQSGDNLSAVTTPIGLNANWYNIQTEDSTTRIWLMEEDASSFTPTFDCSYFIVVSDNGCTDTSEIYAYGENAARIGSFITSPNPTSGLINVKFDNHKNQFVMLELISNNGSKLDEFITIENNLDIDLSKYPSGSYFLYFNSEDAVQGCRLEEVQKVSTKIILNK